RKGTDTRQASKSRPVSCTSEPARNCPANYAAQHRPAMTRLLAAGAQLRAFSPEILDASYKAAQDTYAEISQTNALFKKLNESISAYRSEAYLWWQIAELPFDSYMIRMRARTRVRSFPP